MVNKCLVALGANLSSSTRAPVEQLRYALELLKGESIDLAALSNWYSTPAFPASSGPDYINAVALVETRLGADAVLNVLASIEEKLGRVRSDRWGARVCDLDLLTYGNAVLPDLTTHERWRDLSLDRQLIETPEQLIIPHPRIQDRAFVLVPLRDVEPNWRHPVTGIPIGEIIDALPASEIEAITPLEVTDK